MRRCQGLREVPFDDWLVREVRAAYVWHLVVSDLVVGEQLQLLSELLLPGSESLVDSLLVHRCLVDVLQVVELGTGLRKV